MTRTLTAASLLFTLAACTTQGSEYADLLPDDRLLVDMPASQRTARSALGDASEYQAITAEVTGDLNTLIGQVLSDIDHITDFQPTWTDAESRALWGPWEDDGVTGRLWVEEKDDGSYAWALEVKRAEDGEEAWLAVVAGEIDAGATAEASSGRLGLDFGAIAAIEPMDDIASGLFYVDYAFDDRVVDAEAVFSQLVGTGGETADAAYAYGTDRVGAGYLDLAVLTQAVGGPDPEVHLVRSRWNAMAEGRADVYLTEGDLGPLVYNLTECWDSEASVVFYEDNYDFTRSGEESACAFEEPAFNETEEVAR